VSDLRPGDFVFIECACGRIWLATKTPLLSAGLLAKSPIAELAPRLHCPQCNRRGLHHGIGQMG
jgi:hypothetical protein